jgi:hypothetical protein
MGSRYVAYAGDGRALYQFEALQVVRSGPGEVVVQARPADASQTVGDTNLYLLDIAAQTLSFVATTSWADYTPLAAGGDLIAWTDGFCAVEPGHTRLYSRSRGSILELPEALAPYAVTPEGLLAVGLLGPTGLIEPNTGQYAFYMLGEQAATQATADFKYMVSGLQRGLDSGPCGR